VVAVAHLLEEEGRLLEQEVVHLLVLLQLVGFLLVWCCHYQLSL
jgi:hypothetical protein